MRAPYLLLVLASLVRADNRPQLEAALYVLDHAVKDARTRTISDAQLAFDLDPAPLHAVGV